MEKEPGEMPSRSLGGGRSSGLNSSARRTGDEKPFDFLNDYRYEYAGRLTMSKHKKIERHREIERKRRRREKALKQRAREKRAESARS
jgi:hypothetical protein